MRLLSGLLFLMLSSASIAEQPVRFINDWRWEGPQAPLLWALDEGFYADEGLTVSMTPGAGSLQAIPQVATGDYDIGIADVNSLIKYRDQNPDQDVRAVFVIYNSPPFAILGRPSLGVIGPSDLEGRTLGAPSADGAFAQWPTLVQAYGLKPAAVDIQDVDFDVREAMLAKGRVDAIMGFSFSSYINLQAQGVPVQDISLMLMSDFGLDLYGNVIIVNPDFARTHPEAVSGFLLATTRGYQETIAHPAAAIKYVLSRNSEAVESDELARLILAIGHHIVNDEVRENGLGSISMPRLERAIDQISQSYEFRQLPSANDVFDERYLPEAGRRGVPVSPGP